jgi:ABC-type hemin transport system substrate-binding protein
VSRIFAAAGLRVWDVEELPTHGGSLRVYGCRASAQRQNTPRAAAMLSREAAEGLTQLPTYANFQARADRIKDDLLLFLIEQKRAGKRVAAYGAAAKGNTLLNYAGVKPDLLSYVCDAATAKQGKYLPGSHIPIHPPEALLQDPPDHVLVLPWNLATEIRAQLAGLEARSVKFVTAVPTLSIQ